MTRKKNRPKKKLKTMSTPEKQNASNSALNLVMDPVTSTPIEIKADPKRKRDDLSSVSTNGDSFSTDLDSDQVKMKIKSIVEESVKAATEAAIHAAKTAMQTGLEALFNHKMDILESRIFELEKTSDKHSEFDGKASKELLSLQSQTKNQNATIAGLQAQLKQIQINLKQCQVELNDNAQYTRKNTVRIFGLEQTDFKNENIYERIQKLFSEKLKLTNIDVEVAHRVGPVNHEGGTINKTRPVICKLLRRTDKMKVISVRRQLKGQGVSISDELTKYNFELLKKLQEHKLIQQAWSYNGKIFAKNKNNVIKRVVDIMSVDTLFG